ncbi:O-antigen ligase family protein [Vibrio cholerae]|uniref:O-antigen ligase family protein n=2 Tax=Vibrio cholerae TaxID=666 RepID=UPI000E0A6DF9|nr:O-antigen ligase family protein [Vibrio cholerae]
MHLKRLNGFNEFICLIIFVFSFFSINSLKLNPAYIGIASFIFSVTILIFRRQKISSFSFAMIFFSLIILVSQFYTLFNVDKSKMAEPEVNYFSAIIFGVSILYSVTFIELFKDKDKFVRLNLYRWSGYILCAFLLIELAVRINIGSLSLGLLYGFKKSLFYFDSNFIGIMIMSFIMFYLYLSKVYNHNFRLLICFLFLFLILTMSRAAIFSTLIACCIFYSKKNFKLKAYSSLLLYAMIFLSFSYIYLFDDYSFQDLDGSFNSKFYIVSKAIDIYNSLPESYMWFGIGLGNFDKYTGIFAHNIFVTIFIEMGIIGSVVFILLVAFSALKSNSMALYIWVPTLICGISLFGVYTPYLFLINAAIFLENKKINSENLN